MELFSERLEARASPVHDVVLLKHYLVTDMIILEVASPFRQHPLLHSLVSSPGSGGLASSPSTFTSRLSQQEEEEYVPTADDEDEDEDDAA